MVFVWWCSSCVVIRPEYSKKGPDSNGLLSKDAKKRRKEQEAKDAGLSEEVCVLQHL